MLDIFKIALILCILLFVATLIDKKFKLGEKIKKYYVKMLITTQIIMIVIFTTYIVWYFKSNRVTLITIKEFLDNEFVISLTAIWIYMNYLLANIKQIYTQVEYEKNGKKKYKTIRSINSKVRLGVSIIGLFISCFTIIAISLGVEENYLKIVPVNYLIVLLNLIWTLIEGGIVVIDEYRVSKVIDSIKKSNEYDKNEYIKYRVKGSENLYTTIGVNYKDKKCPGYLVLTRKENAIEIDINNENIIYINEEELKKLGLKQIEIQSVLKSLSDSTNKVIIFKN